MKESNHLTNPFPCRHLPGEPGLQKLLGLYRQVQDGLWLQRIRVPGGRLTGTQWRQLAEINTRFTPRTPLHLTTRQDVEIHDLTPELIPPVQEALDAVRLRCFGAAGDTFRNITICPCAGSAPGSVDLMPLGLQIDRTLCEIDGITELPRKFKIALACSPNCGQPWINDLGLIAQHKSGVWGFEVIVAGSLGAKPGTGMKLYDWIPARDVLPLAVATIDVFANHGDRANRRKARLRHVKERLGEEWLAKLLNEAYQAAKTSQDWPDVTLPEADRKLEAQVRLTFANGDVTAEVAAALGELQDDEALRVRIANQHRVILYGPNESYLAERIADHASLAPARELETSVVACPGKRWCSRAIVHTNELADRIRSNVGGRLPAGATICISGCPNGCSHPAVADIGLIGCLATVEGQKQEAFHLYAHGGMGRDGRLGVPLERKLTADDTIGKVAKVVEGLEAKES